MSFKKCLKNNFNKNAVRGRVSKSDQIYLMLIEQEQKTGVPTTDVDLANMVEIEVTIQEEAYNKELFHQRCHTIPLRYRDYTFTDYKCSDNRDRAIVAHMASGRPGILHGANGTGKTMLAYCAIKQQWEKDRYAQYILAADYFDMIKNSFNGGDPLKVLAEFTEYDYLVVDEIDKKYGTQTEHIYLYRLINERYDAMKPTVLISNSNRADLETVIGISAFSRVAGEGMIIEFTGKDYRKKERLK